MDSCHRCKLPLSEDQIGYCEDCLAYQEHEAKYLRTPAESHWQIQRRQAEIREFLDKGEYRYVSLEAIGENPESVYGILRPELAAALDYSLIRQVAYVQDISPERVQWLKDYWEEKYEVILDQFGEFHQQVGLIFWGESYYGIHRDVYDFPANMFLSFVKEGEA